MRKWIILTAFKHIFREESLKTSRRYFKRRGLTFQGVYTDLSEDLAPSEGPVRGFGALEGFAKGPSEL